jgi:hypothetical protein
MAVKSNFASGDVLNASDVNTYLTNGGLVYINGGSGNNVASFTVSDCFTSTYNMYRLVLSTQLTTTNLTVTLFQLMNGATLINTNYVSRSLWANLLTVATTFQDYDNSTTAVTLGCPSEGTTGSLHSVDIASPNAAQATYFTGNFTGARAGVAYYMGPLGGVQTSTTQATGFRITTPGYNFNYRYRIYGYREA